MSLASPGLTGPVDQERRARLSKLQERVSPAMALGWVMALAFALRLLFAATTGLGNDESYTVVTSRSLALSYFDHPPMAWWLAHMSAALFGTEAPLAVRAPFLLLSMVSSGLMYVLTARLFGRWAGVWAALTMACAPVLGLTSATWVLPDGPLITFLLAGTLVIAHALFDPRAHPATWLLAGALGGLALLSKYHGIFLFAGTFVFLLLSARHRRWLGTIWPYAGVAVALVVFSPVIVWNVGNGFTSLAFQGERASAEGFHPLMALMVVSGIALFLTPWIWLGLVAAAVRALRTKPINPRALLLLCIAAGPVLVFPAIAAWSGAKPFFHWAAPGYLMLFPLLGRATARRWAGNAWIRGWTIWSAGFATVGVAAIATISLVPSLGTAFSPTNGDPLRELARWSDLDAAVRRHGLAPGPYAFVTVPVWHMGGKAGYALGPSWPVACMGSDCRGFLISDVQRGRAGADAVLVLDAASPGQMDEMAQRFRSVETLETVEIRHAGTAVALVVLAVGRGYLGEPRPH
ncbi:glycosyltransferase family 39 protein [Xanthobacter flavus]|uniref:glycosyltransferase family 39 protein n=1 Tax=Xanthobacter flavus TaxID=281 RepID=UPI001AEA2C30|nr:4-amino-4-deoxy-L-arabinose transferase-like glycosyltransferase [Xanthobacter flavus]